MTNPTGEPGVVIHLNDADPDRQAGVLRNITNLRAELGDETPTELVVHGPGLSICRADNQHADAVRTLLAAGVTVAACANTMRSQNLTVDNLIDGVRVVPAGVAELVRKQREGWAYLRP
jgi:intracellular sulfur oxidation DsrE/DsrF family protein